MIEIKTDGTDHSAFHALQRAVYEGTVGYDQLPKRYRIEDPYHDDGRPTLVTYYVVRKTKSGAWVAPRWAVSGFDASTGKGVPWGELKRDQLRMEGARFVLDGDGKRFAHESVEWARASYKRRKQWQIRWAQRSIRRAENGLHWLMTGKSMQDEVQELPMAISCSDRIF
jgi:hypothetical protein